MSDLLAVVASIALLDSMSITPPCSVPLLALLAGHRPLLGAFRQRLEGFLTLGGHRLVAAIRSVVGGVVTLDSIGWLLGHPLINV